MRTLIKALWLLPFLALSSCGGGGGSEPAAPAPPVSPPPPPPTTPAFGLKSKPALTGLRFPAAGAETGALRIAKAFPNLGFEAPLWFGQAPGNNSLAYVAEQGGRVWVFSFDAGVTTKSLFLDLTDRTRANGEQGLLGFAFAPDFASNRSVYAYYSKNANPDVNVGNHTLARFTASADGLTASAASGVVLLDCSTSPILSRTTTAARCCSGPMACCISPSATAAAAATRRTTASA